MNARLLVPAVLLSLPRVLSRKTENARTVTLYMGSYSSNGGTP